MSALPFGIDISRYQYGSKGEKPNFDTINATCDFVAVRAGISWGYTDPKFYESALTAIMAVLSIIGVCMIFINFWLDFRENK